MGFCRTINFDAPREVALICDVMRSTRGVKVIEVREQTRTKKQNALYWVDVVEPLADWMTESQGEQWTKDDVHEFLKRECLPLVERPHPITGELKLLTASTTRLTKDEFSVLIEKGRSILDFLRNNQTRKAI